MINNEIIGKIKEEIGGLLCNYAKEIEAVMAKEEMVTISMPVKIKQIGPKLDIEVGIGFVKERVRDAIGFTVDGQQELFEPGA